MSYRLTLGNFKGGTGKTSNSCTIAYTLAKKGYKVLLLDLDPQADATKLLFSTKENETGEKAVFETSFMQSIVEGNIENILTPITENLFILPSAPDFRYFNLYLEKTFSDDFYSRGLVINTLLNDLEKRHHFDFVLIDTPPTVSTYTENAILSSNGVIIVLQTQERALGGAISFLNYIHELSERYNKDIDILGILPVLNKKSAYTDNLIMKKAISHFSEEGLFRTVIPHLERIKKWDTTGIINKDQNQDEILFDMHDENVFSIYNKLIDEIIEKIEKNRTERMKRYEE